MKIIFILLKYKKIKILNINIKQYLNILQKDLQNYLKLTELKLR